LSSIIVEISNLEKKPMSENHALAPLPQRTLDGWHRFVASGDRDPLASLLSEHIVFRSPLVQSPIPGRSATLLVLTTVVQIFENFRYHRSFIAGAHDAALEFSANIGKWQLRGIDLIKFNEAGEMIEFEVMVRPIKALAALGEEMGNRIGPQLTGSRKLPPASADGASILGIHRPAPRLRARGPCGKDRPALRGFLADSRLRYAAVAQW
jgi:hypothetical protein